MIALFVFIITVFISKYLFDKYNKNEEDKNNTYTFIYSIIIGILFSFLALFLSKHINKDNNEIYNGTYPNSPPISAT